jgi:hypothetical protein
MEKFFNLSCILGKKIVFVLTVLLLLSAICSAISIVSSFIPIKTEYPNFEKVLSEQQALYGDKEHDKKQAQKLQLYIKVIDEIVADNNLNNYGRGVIVKHINTIDNNIKDDYTKGLRPFIKNYYVYMNGKNIDEDMLRGVLEDYEEAYIKNNTIKEFKQEAKKLQKVFSILIFISSLLMFLLCLLFPIIVKIEENTRK